MKIAVVASEVVPFSKTGGLGDVIGALPRALEELGLEVTVISPLYAVVRTNSQQLGIELKECSGGAITVPIGDIEVEGRVLEGHVPGHGCRGTGVRVLFLENDAYFDRPGLYTSPRDGTDYQDNSERFVFLCRGALEACKALGVVPDVFHCHDWQTGLLPVYLKHLYREDFPRSGSVFTVHNVAYQGLFWHWDMKLTGLPWELFDWRMLEYYGNLSFLKGGLVGADKLTTVSRRYAEEIQTEEHGMGLEGVLLSRAADLCGIVNGVDYSVWNPEHDPAITRHYSPDDLSGKAECKRALQEVFELPLDQSVPVIGLIGRLVDQKGFDLVVAAMEELMARQVQLVFLAAGQPAYHEMLTQLRERYPARIGVRLDFDDALAHQIEAGSDMFLMPSRFEPCGLNQLYSMKYGTVPVVSETGGLADTVVECPDTGTGFLFAATSAQKALAAGGGPIAGGEMVRAIDRALKLYRDDADAWRALMLRGMAQDWSWGRSAQEYVEVFEEAARAPAKEGGK
ncbi:MAG: glycogen synthase GlgA [Candidatus Brocadiia bacterium]|jgi:starch synthase|nr:glycogen synthase GlgA [Candidatus Brocadiia bacterium]